MSKNRLSQDEIRSLLQGSDRSTQLAPPENTVDGSWAAEASDSTEDGDRARKCYAPGESSETPEAWAGLEDLVDHVRVALSEHLRAPVQVVLTGAERMSRCNFVQRCNQPTFLATSVLTGEDQEIVLDISLPILFPAINRMLGGDLQDDPIPPRPLTRIETGLANRFADRIVGALLACRGETQPDRWKTIAGTEALENGRLEVKHDSVACVDLTVSLGPASGLLRIAIAWEMFKRTADREAKTQVPGTEAVEVSVVLARTSIASSKLADLQPGDLVASQLALGELFEVLVDGSTRFRASLGALDGRKAVKIEQIEQIEDASS